MSKGMVFFIANLVTMTNLTTAIAQELELFGYYENQFFPQELKGEVILQDYNKLRLDLSADVGDQVSFNGDVIFQTYHGKTEFSALDFIPAVVVKDYLATIGKAADEVQDLFHIRFEDEIFLDNAYASVYTQHVNFRIGKQQLPWGAGYTWNPTDIFNQKEILDPTYEKVGVNAFKVEVPIGQKGMLTGILGVAENFTNSTRAIKFSHHAAGFDFSASFVAKLQQGFDFYAFNDLAEQRKLLGLDFAGELFGLGIWGEGAYNSMQNSRNFGQYLAGVDYTFNSGLYLITEYYRNGWGKSDNSAYDINDWMHFLGTDGTDLGRDYVFAGNLYPIAELWNWANYFIVNLNDKSGIFFPWFDYSLTDNAELIFAGYVPFGGKTTEFGGFGLGGFARIRLYF
jgi:hypothetical protein